LAILGEMDDPETHLRVRLAVSRAAPLGSQMLQSANRRVFGNAYRISMV
jgi:hypothetical protein